VARGTLQASQVDDESVLAHATAIFAVVQIHPGRVASAGRGVRRAGTGGSGGAVLTDTNMHFNFALTPVERVKPWGHPGDETLHWFGLTDGQYWIQAGDAALLEYSTSMRELCGAPRYCEYQVARLYEDLLEMLCHVLEPVPPSLVERIAGDGARNWDRTVAYWQTKHGDRLDEDRYWKLLDASTTWIAARRLDTLYLSPSAGIRIWSDGSMVNLEWDNRDKLADGVPAWSATHGSHQLPMSSFLVQVRSFHTRLMEQMASRVEQVAAGALPRNVQIDLPGLRREQLERCQALDEALQAPVASDWAAVREAIAEIEREAGSRADGAASASHLA
jgi:hypothetical protein